MRSGTSVADVEPPPVPRMALPSRPLAGSMLSDDAANASSSSSDEGSAPRGVPGYLRVARAYPALWMVVAPVALASLVVGLTLATSKPPAASPLPPAPGAMPTKPGVAAPREGSGVAQRVASVEELEARPAESLSASELLRVADGRAGRRVAEARALGEKLGREPELAADKATQAELLRLARDAETAREALGALARLETPLGADLLYEVWTGTAVRTEATELARALVYSPDVRPRASAALDAALQLRAASSCDAAKAALPHALKNGDRRSIPPLTKLTVKRGCGPKKTEDCYACLRAQPDELKATINAAKSRRAPVFPAP